MRDYLVILSTILLALCLIWSCLSDVFLSWPNLFNILTASSALGLLAIGAALVIGSGGIDLSVGSLIAFSGMASALLIADGGGNFFAVVGVSLLAGTAAGAFNGYLIGALKLPPFIVTLGMLSLARGTALIISDGRPVYKMPRGILLIGQDSIFGVPCPVVIFVTTAVAAHLLLTHTRFGAHLLAIGDNERAARNAGVKIVETKVKLYALSGGLAALAGLIIIGRVNAADPSAGLMHELTAITAAIIGGARLSGGRASVVGAVLGALIIGVLQNGLTLTNMPSYYQQVVIGAVLIIAVTISRSRGGGGYAVRD